MCSNIWYEIDRIWQKQEKKACIIFEGKEYNYAEITILTAQISAKLKILGCKEGSRIGLISKNSIFSVCLIMASAQLGLLCCPINDELNISQLETQLSTLEASLYFIESKRICNWLTSKNSQSINFRKDNVWM